MADAYQTDEIYEIGADGNFDITVPAPDVEKEPTLPVQPPVKIEKPTSPCCDDHEQEGGASANAAAANSYYHFDSKGNKFKNKWDSYDVDAELEKVDPDEDKPQAKPTKPPAKPKPTTKAATPVDQDEEALAFDPNDPTYKDMQPEQLEAVKMALTCTDAQIKQMPPKDREMLTQFRDIHKQRMRMAKKNGNGAAPTAVDVKEELRKQSELRNNEVKDPEEELKKLFKFLGTDKKWSTESKPTSVGDGTARSASEEHMIAETKKQQVKASERARLKKEKERYTKENTPPSSPGDVAKSATAKNTDAKKLFNKVNNTKSVASRKKGKKKDQKDKKDQFAALKKMTKAKPFEF